MTHFRCLPLGCALSPSACAARHHAARSAARAAVGSATCATCRVGAAHELGRLPERWPDGSPVVRLTLSATSAPPPAPRHVVRIRDRGSEQLARGLTDEERAERTRAAQKRYEAKRRAKRGERAPATSRKGCGVGISHGGRVIVWGERALTAAQWSHQPEVKALGLCAETIESRVWMQGWTPERALTTPPGTHARTHTWGERTLRLSQWAREPECVALGITLGLLKRRVNAYRWPIERAVTTPIDTARQRVTRRTP